MSDLALMQCHRNQVSPTGKNSAGLNPRTKKAKPSGLGRLFGGCAPRMVVYNHAPPLEAMLTGGPRSREAFSGCPRTAPSRQAERSHGSVHQPLPFENWQAVLDAPRPAFFRGHTSDTVFDRAPGPVLAPSSEALFTQSNARLLLGQAANGSLRFVALPTQVYPAPTQTAELGLGPGMYHHFDVAMYAGDLSYQVWPEGEGAPIDLAADDRDNETCYADHFLPLTRARAGNLDVALVSLAPVAAEAASAPLAPAPLPGPAGAIYALRLHNTGTGPVRGQVILQAGDLLVGHYEDAAPKMRELKRPSVDLRQRTLILTRPYGSVGIHLHEGHWTRTEAPFQAERAFELAPGQETVFETHLALGKTYHDVMPVIYALHLRPALDWLNLTAGFWRSRLGQLEVGTGEEATFSRDIYLRSLFDNFNCLQTDAEGQVIAHWQGAPSHGYGTVWGIDVEPTAVSIVQVCPELARETMVFFVSRSRAPKGPADHSVPILVAPVIIARQWLQVTGDAAYLRAHPEVMAALQSIMDDLEALRAPNEALFPSRYSSDGPVGRRYDYGTNVKVYYAFDSFAYLLRELGRPQEAAHYAQVAGRIRQAIERTMVVEGPFGPQISGGTNLGEDPGHFYLPEGTLYYDGEDTSSMLAPIYGLCDFTHRPWVNYHRFARSLWCPNYDPEFDALRWNPGNPGVFDGTGYFSHLGGAVTRAEMGEALTTLRQVATDEVTGSVFWWPHGLEYRRALTRCSQGQGAWAWQYLEQWLGLKVDAATQTLTFAPRGLLTQVDWQGFAAGPHRFDVHWHEDEVGATAQVRNGNDCAWTVRVGFRRPGTGAEGPLAWQARTLAPGEEATFAHQAPALPGDGGVGRAAMARLEAAAFGDGDGIVFRRLEPELLWGHWDPAKAWDARAMPLAVRFVILNGTNASWSDLSVALTCPEGWRAEGRPPRHWARPEKMAPGTVRLELGELPAMGRTVAAFWVKGPQGWDPEWSWDNPAMPFHYAKPAEEGLVLRSAEVQAPMETALQAELTATAADGSRIRRRLRVPVRVLPGR